MTDYRAAAADYLATRRAMGYKLAYQGQMLAQFAAYLDAVGTEHLTIRHAIDGPSNRRPRRARGGRSG
jgi:hypothetical protein